MLTNPPIPYGPLALALGVFSVFIQLREGSFEALTCWPRLWPCPFSLSLRVPAWLLARLWWPSSCCSVSRSVSLHMAAAACFTHHKVSHIAHTAARSHDSAWRYSLCILVTICCSLHASPGTRLAGLAGHTHCLGGRSELTDLDLSARAPRQSGGPVLHCTAAGPQTPPRRRKPVPRLGWPAGDSGRSPRSETGPMLVSTPPRDCSFTITHGEGSF